MRQCLTTAVDMREPPPAVGQGLGGPLLLQRRLLAVRFLGRPAALQWRARAGQDAQHLAHWAPCRSGRRRCLGPPRGMGVAAGGVAQPEDRAGGLDEQAMVHRVLLLLATLTHLLCRKGPEGGPCAVRSRQGSKGGAGVAAGTGATGAGSSASGMPTVTASPSHGARASGSGWGHHRGHAARSRGMRRPPAGRHPSRGLRACASRPVGASVAPRA